ncbi:MAG: hypothetical protein BMS9Abin08_0022 [Gammaproteobacteria bacterium]|nr:MAG: hypothetical protein BMS9Abin08_0022 [Gammaproteobacteria bacterium]
MVLGRIAIFLAQTGPGHGNNKCILMTMNLFQCLTVNPVLQHLYANKAMLVKVQEPCAISH